MEPITERTGDEPVHEVETAQGIFPNARVTVRQGRVIVLTGKLIMLEPFVWAFQHAETWPD